MLGDCGASFADVAKTTVFVTDMATSRVNEVYADVFGDHRPARSTVEVAVLPAARWSRSRSGRTPTGRADAVLGVVLDVVLVLVSSVAVMVGMVWAA